MDNGHLSPFVVIVIILSALGFAGFSTYVIRDHLVMRRYAKNNPLGGTETETFIPKIDVWKAPTPESAIRKKKTSIPESANNLPSGKMSTAAFQPAILGRSRYLTAMRLATSLHARKKYRHSIHNLFGICDLYIRNLSNVSEAGEHKFTIEFSFFVFIEFTMKSVVHLLLA